MPYVAIRSRAPFSPMPGTPLMLSIESPISASTSTTCAGATPNFSFTPSASNHVPSSFRVVDRDAVVHELEEVLVAGDDRHLEAGVDRLRRQRPDHVVGLEALEVRIGTPSASQASWTQGICSARSGGIGARFAL